MALYPRAVADPVALAAVVAEQARAVAAEALKQDASTAATDVEVAAAFAARTLVAGAGLTGGGTLAADRMFAADFGSVAGKVAQGNDARLTDARVPTSHHVSHEAGGTDAMVVDAAVGVGSLRTLGVGAAQAAQGSVAAAHQANTANPHAVTKAQVGLGSADNTADVAKPVSTAQQTALDLKAPLASPALTGSPTAPTAAPGTTTTQVASTAFVAAGDALAIPLTQKAAGSGVPSLDGASRVVQSPKLHATDHQPGGTDALAVDAVAGTGSLRTLGTGATQAMQGSLAAPLASPALTGSPTAPTQAAADNSTKVATTAYADTLGALLVPRSLVDAKGDLFAGTADNTVTRKAAGTNEMALLADSSQADGLRWAYPRMALQQRAVLPTGAISEGGVGRNAALASQSLLTSGTLRLGSLMVLPAGVAVNTIRCESSNTAAVTPTNQWFCLVRVSDLAVLRKTADDLTTAWAAFASKSLTLSSAYTPSTDELVWVGVMVAAGTIPTLYGWTVVNSGLGSLAPAVGGNSTTGLTTPASLGAAATTPGASGLSFYSLVS